MEDPPVHQLSPELMALIFFECLPQDVSPVSPRFIPMLLTLICRRWREIAQNTPELWSNVQIRFQIHKRRIITPVLLQKFRQELERKATAIALWMKLAGNSKMSVDVDIYNEQLESLSFYVRNQIFRVVIGILDKICIETSTNKWRDLHLRRLDEPYRSRFFSIPPEDLRSLEHLSSWFRRQEAFPLEADFTLKQRCSLTRSGVIAAPRLHSLLLAAPDVKDKIEDLPLANWKSLTELTLKDKVFKSSAISVILSRCAKTLRLLHVVLGSCPQEIAKNKNLPKISLPSLRTLFIHEIPEDRESPSHLHPFMMSIDLPSLASLEFTTGCDAGFGPSSLLTLVQANASNLANLTDIQFEYNYLQPEELRSFLSLIGGPGANVTSLYMEGGDIQYRDMLMGPPPYSIFWSWVLEEFHPSGTSSEGNHEGEHPPPILFPKLERFQCILARKDEFDDQDLLTFLKYRLGQQDCFPTRLRSVTVDFVSEKTVEVAEELAGVVDMSDFCLSIQYGMYPSWTSI